jgi:hypothetical protein
MITRDDIIDALTKCSAYDAQHTPIPADIVLAAWQEHFELYPNVTRADLMAAVREYFTTRHVDQLTPYDLSTIARKYARDRYERSDLDSIERRNAEAVCDAKAAPDLAAIEAAAPDRQRTIAEYARRFGIGEREAEVRMQPGRGEANERDAIAVAVNHRRMEAPPVPIPCPECDEIANPCRCDATAVQA